MSRRRQRRDWETDPFAIVVGVVCGGTSLSRGQLTATRDRSHVRFVTQAGARVEAPVPHRFVKIVSESSVGFVAARLDAHLNALCEEAIQEGGEPPVRPVNGRRAERLSPREGARLAQIVFLLYNDAMQERRYEMAVFLASSFMNRLHLVPGNSVGRRACFERLEAARKALQLVLS